MFDDDISDYRDYILSSIGIIEIANTLRIQLMESHAGNFTHRATCPFLFHKQGNEHTPSFRINSKNNNFFCYGCSTGGNSANLIQYIVGCPYEEALKKIAIISGILDGDELVVGSNVINEPQKPTIDNIIFECSILLRDYLMTFKNYNNYKNEEKWVDDTFIKIDKILGSLDKFDIEKATKIKNNIIEITNNRLEIYENKRNSI